MLQRRPWKKKKKDRKKKLITNFAVYSFCLCQSYFVLLQQSIILTGAIFFSFFLLLRIINTMGFFSQFFLTISNLTYTVLAIICLTSHGLFLLCLFFFLVTSSKCIWSKNINVTTSVFTQSHYNNIKNKKCSINMSSGSMGFMGELLV